MMEIQKFFHDPDPLKNRELFGLLGEYGLSQRVRGAFGGACYVRTGTTLVHHDRRT